eukprot:scaffold6592_cov103-Skeletonema_dohrnii-CCMP3373.AAC.11
MLIAPFTELDTIWCWSGAGGRPKLELDLISSPTTLKHGQYTYEELEKWHTSFSAIVTNHNGPLEKVDHSIPCEICDLVLERCWWIW